MAVLLIGGTSGTGKTTVAEHLSTRLMAQILDVDAYRARLGSHPTQNARPGPRKVIERGEAILDLPTARQLELKLRVARDVCASLEEEIREQLSRTTTMVFEGDDVLPELTDRFPRGALRAIFILPRSEHEVARRDGIRDPALASTRPDRRERRIRVTWLYAEWLRGEAVRRDLPVLDAAETVSLIAQAELVFALDRP